MERLTFRIETGEAFTDRAYPCEIPLLKSEIGGIAIAKLAAYEDAEENGTLVRLPCKVGDERYFISSDGFIEKGTIRDIQIAMTTDYNDEVFYINGVTRQKWIGRDGMYITREEAEKALKERESE